MYGEGDRRMFIQRVGKATFRMRHPSKLFLPQKGHQPLTKNAKNNKKKHLQRL